MISVKAFEIISRFFYVDDGTGCSGKWEECKDLCSELKQAMKLSGFSLAKWKFSHRSMKQQMDKKFEEEEKLKKKRKTGLASREPEREEEAGEEGQESSKEEEVPDLINVEEEEEEEILIHSLSKRSEWEEDAEEIDRILSIVWDMRRDRLSVAVEEEKFSQRAKTPRQVVQEQASLYNPPGILAPFILLGRKWTQRTGDGIYH